MKTLKKTLCLVLAVVMAVGVLVIPANAATSFPDDADIEHDEAVAVLNGLGILKGDDEGNFNPDTVLKRAEAAKIIAYMMLGEDDAEDYVASGDPFTDVADYQGGWAVNYVAYCADNDIIGGNGDGTFNPAGELTGTAFAKMLLCAIGYDGDIEGFGGSNWAKNVESIARKEGLNDNLTSFQYSAPLSRDSAAQMAYNCIMKAEQVTGYTGGTDITLPGGVTITQGADRDMGVTLAVSEYGLYKLDDDNGWMEDGEDDFGRPYSYQIAIAVPGTTDTNSDGTPDDAAVLAVLYTKTAAPVKVYTAKAKESDIKKDLKGYTVPVTLTSGEEDKKIDETVASGTISVDGNSGNATTDLSASTPAKAIENLTGNGKVVEIYGSNKQVTNIVVVEYVLAKVKSVSDKKVELASSVSGTTVAPVEFDDSDEADNTLFDALSQYAKDDYLMVAVASGTTHSVLDFADVQQITGMLTGVTTSSSGHNSGYTIDGTKYAPAVKAKTTWSINKEPTPSATTSVIALLDQYGYIVDFLSAKTAAPQYLYVVHEYTVKDEWDAPIGMFQGVLTDGTEVVAEYKHADSSGVVQTTKVNAATVYSYVENDGVYTLIDTSGTAVQTITAGSNVATSQKRLPCGNSAFYASDVKTILINGSKDDLKISVKDGLVGFTGNGNNDFAVLNSSGYVSVIFVNGNSDVTPDMSTDLIYVAKATSVGEELDEAGISCKTYELYINGEKQTVMVNNASVTVGWYEYSINSAGRYVLDNSHVDSNTATDIKLTATGDDKIEAGDGIYYMTVTNPKIELADATDAKVVDLKSSSNKITSVEALYEAIKPTEDGVTAKEITVAFSYSGSTNKVIDMIYITNIADAAN